MKEMMKRLGSAYSAFRKPPEKTIANAVKFHARMDFKNKTISVYQLKSDSPWHHNHNAVQLLDSLFDPTKNHPILTDQPIAKFPFTGDEIIHVTKNEMTWMHSSAIHELKSRYFKSLEEKQNAIAANTALMIETDYTGSLGGCVDASEFPKISEMICIGYRPSYEGIGWTGGELPPRQDIMHIWAQPVAIVPRDQCMRNYSFDRHLHGGDGKSNRYLVVRLINAEYNGIYESERSYSHHPDIHYQAVTHAIPVDAIREIAIGSMLPCSDFPYAAALMSQSSQPTSKWGSVIDPKPTGFQGFSSLAEMLRCLDNSNDPKLIDELFPDHKEPLKYAYLRLTQLYGGYLLSDGHDVEYVARFLMSPAVSRFYSLPFWTDSKEMEPKWISVENEKIAGLEATMRKLCIQLRDAYAFKDATMQMTAELHKQYS